MRKCFRCKSLTSSATPKDIDNFIKRIEPLDLLVFRGADVVSNTIRVLQKMQNADDSFSHVEVAITREWCSKIKNISTPLDTMYSWGSTLSGNLNDGVVNIETGKSKFGVQIRSLHDLVTAYIKTPGANVGVCNLINNPTKRRNGESDVQYTSRCIILKRNIARAYKKYNSCYYEFNPTALLGALFPRLRFLRDITEILIDIEVVDKWLFCSEFVALIYIATGVIDSTVCAANVVPVDFNGAETDVGGIGLICGDAKWILQS